MSSTENKVFFEYIPALDGVRAIAVLLVLLYHGILLFPSLEPFFKGGFLGVDIFFVLSGFLITSILLKEFDQNETISFKNFYMRRMLRLMPAYWLQLAALYVLSPVLFPRSEVDRLYAHDNFLYALFYATNWHRALNGGEVTGLLSHTWSLAVEEQFYLLWPGVLFVLLRRLPRRWIIKTTAGAITAIAVFRAIRWNGTESVHFLYNAFDSRADALLIGCLAGQLVCWRMCPGTDSRFAKLSLTLAAGTVGIVLFNAHRSFSTPFLYLGGFTAFASAIGIVIIWLTQAETKTRRLLSLRPLVWMGKTSYGIYLWHAVVISFVYYLPISSVLAGFAAIVLTFGLAAASYYLLESPFLKLKSRFNSAKPRPSDEIVPAEGSLARAT